MSKTGKTFVDIQSIQAARNGD